MVLLLAYSAWQFINYQRTQQIQQAEYDQSQAFLRRLEQPVQMQFGKSVTLGEWLAEWSRQTGIPVTSSGQTELAPKDAQIPVTFDLPPSSARSALDALAEVVGMSWAPLANETIVIQFLYRPRNSPEAPEIVRHALPLDWPVPEVLKRLITGNPPPFYLDQFLGRIPTPRIEPQVFTAPDQLLIVQPAVVQQRAADFLRTLQLAVERSSSLPRTGVLPNDPRLRPMLLSHGPEHIDLLRQFDRPVTIVADHLPLPQFTQELTRQTGLPFFIHAEQLRANGRSPETPIICEMKQVRLRAVLSLALARRNLSYRLQAGSAQVLIADQRDELRDEHLCTIAYPVADLLTEERPDQFVGKMISFVNSGPGSFGNSGEMELYQHLLIARLPLNQHWILDDLLVAVRQVRSGLAGPRLRAGLPGEQVDGIHTEVFDLRPAVRFSLYSESAVGRMIEKLEQENVLDWHDVQGTTAIFQDTLVLRNSPAVIDQAWNLLEFVRTDLQTGRPIWPDRYGRPEELRGEALSQPILLANDPKERNTEYPRRAAYFVGDLLRPRGRLSRSELLMRCGLGEEDPAAPLDPFGGPSPEATIDLHRLLVVRMAPQEHEKLQATMRTLREEVRP
jgi:hypothetical protein